MPDSMDTGVDTWLGYRSKRKPDLLLPVKVGNSFSTLVCRLQIQVGKFFPPEFLLDAALPKSPSGA